MVDCRVNIIHKVNMTHKITNRWSLPTYLWFGIASTSLIIGCSDKASEGPDTLTVIDTGSGKDGGAQADGEAAADSVADAASSLPDKCKSDKDCIAFDAVCDKSVTGGKCVQCIQDGDCLGDSEKCIQNTCKKVDKCDSDKDCLALNKVCNKSAGLCVDCMSEADCGAEQLCKNNLCVAKPKVCKSSKDCIAEGKVCDKTNGICVECLGNVDCEDGQYCKGDVCAPWACKPNATKCTPDKKLQKCTENGDAWVTSACSGGKDCVDGQCQQTVCTPGAKTCSEGKLGDCSGDGTKVENLISCNKGETCVKDKCVGTACTPGTKTCLDNKSLGTCQPNGKDFEITVCKAPKVCETGGCVDKVCEPGKLFCEASKLMLCSSSGGAAEVADDCPAKGLSCVNGKCGNAGACTPNSVVCTSDKKGTKTCKADGSGYVLLACPANWLCTGGKCVEVICEPNELFCSASDVKKCGTDGTTATVVTTCEATKQCAQGACIPKQCTAGATVCQDKQTLLTCKANGDGYSSNPCPNACSSGKCT